MTKKFFITTPIYYVNDVPHVGHTYTTLAADVIARYHRILGDKVFFLTGTDEHGQKIAEAARTHNKTPKEYSDLLAPQFEKAWRDFNFSFDFFIRTTDPKHEMVVSEVLKKIYQNGYIYKGKYEGLYCVGCEKFLMEDDLIDGKCPYHPNLSPQKQKEENYFFKLSAFQDQLIKAITDRDYPCHYEILPAARKNEILGKLKRGLTDISISRKGVTWGIPLPFDKTQTIYVWVEALFNYYTATQFVENKKCFWPSDLQLMAKDILWFHAVIWEALLLAAGLPLPKKIFAHGFFTINGQKMSKSLGNVISPKELIDNFGVDASRYLLLTAFPFGQDGDISLNKFKISYNADLANGLGNLVSRVAKLCQLKNFDNKTQKPDKINYLSKQNHYYLYLSTYQFNLALVEIWRLIKDLDALVDSKKVWELTNEQAGIILTELVTGIRQAAFLLQPFLPITAEKIEKQFSQTKITPLPPLFLRIK